LPEERTWAAVSLGNAITWKLNIVFSSEVWPQEGVCPERRNAEIRFLPSNSSRKPESTKPVRIR